MKEIVFFGSSPFSTIVLNRILNTEHRISAVVTTPDKPAGRHLKLTPNPVKVSAQKHGVLVIESFEKLIENLLAKREFSKLDLKIENSELVGLVAAYGKIIPQDVINLFAGKLYNIHPSLLPKYRGPSPLQQQILDGITQTGVTIIQLDALMDHGPIVAQIPDTILPSDTWITLGERLFTAGADWFIENLFQISNFKFQIQDDSQATYTKKLTRQDGYVPWEEFCSQLSTNNSKLEKKFHAFFPWPGVWTTNPAGQRVKLISLNPLKTLSQVEV